MDSHKAVCTTTYVTYNFIDTFHGFVKCRAATAWLRGLHVLRVRWLAVDIMLTAEPWLTALCIKPSSGRGYVMGLVGGRTWRRLAPAARRAVSIVPTRWSLNAVI